MKKLIIAALLVGACSVQAETTPPATPACDCTGVGFPGPTSRQFSNRDMLQGKTRQAHVQKDGLPFLSTVKDLWLVFITMYL